MVESTGLKWWQYYLIGFGLPVAIVSVTVGMHFGLDEPLYDTTYQLSKSLYNDLKSWKLVTFFFLCFSCWLSTDYGAIWAFLAPVAVVILVIRARIYTLSFIFRVIKKCLIVFIKINMAVLAFAIWKTIEFKRMSNPANKDRKNSRMIFGVLSLTFILGITWIFGFLLFNERNSSYFNAQRIHCGINL